MVTVTVSEARSNLSKVIARAKRDREPVGITSQGEEVAVLLSAEEWEDLQDAIAVREAKAEWEAEGRPTVSLEDIKKRLGMP